MDLQMLVSDFHHVAELAGVELQNSSLTVEKLPAPHEPPSTLPRGKMAVYAFVWGSQCLKVGKVGPKSQARYTSQHYNPNSSQSNLAKSILTVDGQMGIVNLSESNVGNWIKQNVDRFNFWLDSSCGMPVLTLPEAFLQCRMHPIFEGFESQKQS